MKNESIQKNRNFHLSPGRIIAVILAIFWLLVAALPLYYMLLLSFKTQSEFINNGLFSLPKHFSFANYGEVIQKGIGRYFLNSVLVLVIALALLLFISAMAAYPISRMKFRLNKPIYALIIAAMSIPIHITLIPVFEMAIGTKLYDSIWALIGPNVAFNLPMSVFILVGFMQGIPKDIEEAAEIDGCGKARIFFSQIFPLSKPGLATLAIYNGVVIWNEFSFAMTLTQSEKARTLPLAVWQFQGAYTINIPLIMALLILASLPVILLYCFGQDKLVKGMMAGAVKG
jgi:raffinose/stachyose/melibiose transport system permease protein